MSKSTNRDIQELSAREKRLYYTWYLPERLKPESYPDFETWKEQTKILYEVYVNGI